VTDALSPPDPGQAGVVDLFSYFGMLPFTRAEALQAGLTAKQWQQVVKSGRLCRVRQGVYLCERATDDRMKHAQDVASALKWRTNHVACSSSAVALLGLPNPYFSWWSKVPVVIAGPRSDLVHRIRRRQDWDVVPTRWGLCTDLVATAETVAMELPSRQALMVTDQVARHLAGTQDRHVLASEGCRVEVRRRLTYRHDLQALSLANPAADSPAESFYRGLMIEHGFPEPAVGVPTRGASGQQYYIDMLIGRLAIEVDGREKYRDLSVLIDEKGREDDLRLTGMEFLRSWVDDIYAKPGAEMTKLASKLNGTYPQAYPHLRITTAV